MNHARNLAPFVVLACLFSAVGCGHGGGSDSAASETSNKTSSGPSDYHNRYSQIQHTNVSIKDFEIRTEDGQIIHVATDITPTDFQALAGFAQGLNLDLTQAEFPNGASTIQVAEIQVQVIDPSHANIQSSDGTSCTLSSIPTTLNLYTTQPITLGHDAYHVKVAYSPLNSIQLDEIASKSKDHCCTDKDKFGFLKTHGHNHGDFGGDAGHADGDSGGGIIGDNSDGGHSDGDCSSSEDTLIQVCKWVNRRQPITAIVRALDDNF
jgi:hypothetical protein